jgi:hypothetical protein
MSKFLSLLKKNYQNKYQNSTPSSFYVKSRESFLNYFFDLKENIKPINKDSMCQKNKDLLNTKNYLFNLTKKKLNKTDKKNILEFYKKFSFSLKLKKQYNKNLKKRSNTETVLDSYIFLGILVKKLDSLNEIQKLNCLLKLNDITIIKYNKKKHLNLFPYIKKNITYEKQITQKYAKKFILNIS